MGASAVDGRMPGERSGASSQTPLVPARREIDSTCARIPAEGSSSACWTGAWRRSSRDPGRAAWCRGQFRDRRAAASSDGRGGRPAASLHCCLQRRRIVAASRSTRADAGGPVAGHHLFWRGRVAFVPLAETTRPDLVRPHRAGPTQLARAFRTRTRVRRPLQALRHRGGGLSGAAYQAGASLARRSS